jgi:RNase H-fold protein (predicted Holliday junction resolvase)
MLEPTLTVGNKKCFNRLKFNNQGRIYKSPWSPGRHQPLPINWDAFHLREDDFYSLANLQGVKLLEYPSGEQLKDFIEIARFAADAQVIQGSDITKDHELWGALQFLKDELGDELHPKLRLALNDDVIKIAALNALIAWITSQLAKLHFAARRTRFIVRHKFSRVGQDDLIYVPKDRTWEPPPTYFTAKGVISKQLRDIGGGKTSFQARELFQESIAHPLTDSGALLKQLPHDWYLPLDTRLGIGTEISGLPVGKDSVRSPDKLRRTVTTRACRIKGPSSFLTQFTQMLQSRMENGEWMLILDWGFESQLVNQDGQLQLRATLKDCQARVAIPMKNQSAPEESFVLKDRLVAIDLGERQIGYAVFDIPESKDAPVPQPLVDPRTHQRVNGTIRIPGVRSLINTVKTHRGSQSSNTKLRQNYDTRLEQMRESVTAEIVQRIEALMAQYAAFPVLESSVVNFQTGSRQLDLVYGDVVRHFAFSNVDAHKAKRQEHWMGADRWQHPYLTAREYDEATGKYSGKPKPLSLFPGATVNPAGTSQVCIYCQRNALTALRNLGEHISIQEGGVVNTDAGRLTLFSGHRYADAVFQQAKREKRYLPLNVPAKAGTLTIREAISLARRSMRQRSPLEMARDTTQSQFHCLFNDCRKTYHADQGAAVNIGRKFLKERLA